MSWFKWLKKKPQVEAIEAITVDLYEEAIKKLKDEFKEKIAKLISENTELKRKVSSLEKTNQEHISKLREQNDADLLLVALKMAMNITTDKDKKTLKNLTAEYNLLNQQRVFLGQMQAQFRLPSHPFWGLGGLFTTQSPNRPHRE